MAAARSRLHEIFKRADEDVGIKQSELDRILLDLAKYEDEDLIQGSFQLLNKLYSSDSNLFKRAVQAQLLITEESKDLHAEINRLLPSLRVYLNPKCLQSQISTQHSCQVATSPEIQLRERLPLKCLTDKCWLLEGKMEGFEPHHQNQKIIFNFGKMIMTVVHIYIYIDLYL